MEDEGKEPESAVEGAGLLATADDSTEKSDNTEPHCRRKADEPSTQIDFLAPGPTTLPNVHLPPTAALPKDSPVGNILFLFFPNMRKLQRFDGVVAKIYLHNLSWQIAQAHQSCNK